MIPMLDIKRELADIGNEIKNAVNKSIDETMFILGPNVKNFENNTSKYLSSNFASGLGSGTDAIHLALKAAGVKENDEVITTPFTFIATAEAIAYCGAKPVFVDIDYNTMNLDAGKIENAVSDKTKAIIPVHLFGNPCEMDKINETASSNNIRVIEDCAQSFGATYKDCQTGSLGDLGCFSFFPSKNLGCYGDGGLIATNNDSINNEINALRNHGSYKKYYHDKIGFNSRLDDIQAAILNVKLKYIDRFNNDRIAAAEKYMQSLSSFVGFQETTENSRHIYHQFCITTPRREDIIKSLSENDIAYAIYYPVPLHLQKSLAYLGHKKGDFPNAEKLSDEILALPVNPYIEDEEITIVSEVIKMSLKK